MLVPMSLRLLALSSCLLEGNTFRLLASENNRVGRNSASRRNNVISSKHVDENDYSSRRNRFAADLLEAAREVGQVGKHATQENRNRLDELAEKLRHFSDHRPARIPLQGTHQLVYSGSDSGPTAGLVGPFVGKVTQVFWNETVYQNRVRLGPMQVSIFGERTIVDDETIRVRFYEVQVHLWGKQVVQREVTVGPPGTWEHIFIGQVEVGEEKLLLRVMNTPKLFILTQAVE